MKKAINVILLIILAALVLSMSLTPLRSTNDAWWHLKTGKLIWEDDLRLPENDVFAYTSADIPWHNHEWLGQLIMYLATLPAQGVQDSMRLAIVLKAAALLLTYIALFVFCYRETKNAPAALLATMLAVLMSRRTIYPRPPIFSYLFFALFFWLMREVHSGRIRKKWIWALPLLMIPWVNIHGGFLLGIIVVGAWFGSEFLQMIFHKKKLGETRLLIYGGVLAACLAASMINPYTYHLYLLPGRVMGDLQLVRAIPELRSPDFFFTRSFEVMILVLIAGSALVKKKVMTLPEGLLIVFFTHQALQHVRHLPLAGVAAAPAVARILHYVIEEWIPDSIRRFYPRSLDLLLTLFAGIVLCYTVLNHREGESFWERNVNFYNGAGYYENRYPKSEADFILEKNFTGRMFNQINYAGYLIWRMSPEPHKVFTDSRYDIFGGRFMRQEAIVTNGIEGGLKRLGWRDVLSTWDVNFILITADAPVNSKLEESGRWRLVYHLENWKIYVRDVPENAALIRRCLRSEIGVQPPAPKNEETEEEEA